MLSDPDMLHSLAALDADARRIRTALRDGATPESLGLVEGGLDRILRERGLR
jgi:hypothetical protein